ncbi:hypothetical protein ATANTOWER_001160 [Ataeniobius toweri]|uniref:Uncharacterized protein n=1 Tax=Ataeniobius toweri TaxID=208326 RepID=A0ABU7B162_9TELE|nr:hypothetical protein [Ataeniobius toweri]
MRNHIPNQHSTLPGQDQHQTTPKTRTPNQDPDQKAHSLSRPPTPGGKQRTGGVKRPIAHLRPLKCGVDACCCSVHLKRKTGGEHGGLFNVDLKQEPDRKGSARECLLAGEKA